MADGSLEKRDTTPAPPVRRIRGIQSEKDGALIPDAYGELPWPMVRAYGQHEERELLVNASIAHRLTECRGLYGHDSECDGDGWCLRHLPTDIVAEAAVQVRAILEQAAKRAEVDGQFGRLLHEDILAEARRLL